MVMAVRFLIRLSKFHIAQRPDAAGAATEQFPPATLIRRRFLVARDTMADQHGGATSRPMEGRPMMPYSPMKACTTIVLVSRSESAP
jgi:hypothetical protein